MLFDVEDDLDDLAAGERKLRGVEGADGVETGHWGSLATPAALNASAASLGLGDAAFVRYRPGTMIGQNTGHTLRRARHAPGGRRDRTLVTRGH